MLEDISDYDANMFSILKDIPPPSVPPNLVVTLFMDEQSDTLRATDERVRRLEATMKHLNQQGLDT